MIGEARVLAVVPARRGSKGLPLKNIRPLHGKPLLAWPIAAALASRYVDKVIVSTDDREFADIAVAHGAEAPFLRPAELASDEAPSFDFIAHAVEMLADRGERFDYLVLLEPTSPLTEGSDVDAALDALVAAEGRADAIVGVAALEANHPAFAVHRGQDGVITPYGGGGFGALPRRQDIRPLYWLEGSLYISAVGALLRERGFCHARTLGHVMPRHKSLEVDDLVDFLCIEALMAHRDEIEAAAHVAPTAA